MKDKTYKVSNKKCITCDGKKTLTTICEYCKEVHTCICPDCKGKGKLPFNPLILCEECGNIFRCPLTEKNKCKNHKPNARFKKSPYEFVIKNGILIRQCFCKECSSTEEWKQCATKIVEKGKNK